MFVYHGYNNANIGLWRVVTRLKTFSSIPIVIFIMKAMENWKVEIKGEDDTAKIYIMP